MTKHIRMLRGNKSRVIKMKRFLLGGVREIHSFNRMAMVDLLENGTLEQTFERGNGLKLG